MKMGLDGTGKIYLDGSLDWEGNKRAPNGSGNLIIGGRNGGGEWIFWAGRRYRHVEHGT